MKNFKQQDLTIELGDDYLGDSDAMRSLTLRCIAVANRVSRLLAFMKNNSLGLTVP